MGFFSSSSVFPAISEGFIIVDEILACNLFLYNHGGCNISSSWMVQDGCGYVRGIHHSRICM